MTFCVKMYCTPNKANAEKFNTASSPCFTQAWSPKEAGFLTQAEGKT